MEEKKSRRLKIGWGGNFFSAYGSSKNGSHQTLFATLCVSAVSNVRPMWSDSSVLPLILPGSHFCTGKLRLREGDGLLLAREDDQIRHGPFLCGQQVQLLSPDDHSKLEFRRPLILNTNGQSRPQ